SLMAWNIDETQPEFRRQLQVSKTYVNGDPSAFFLFQPVGVNAGKRFNEGGFAMVDVAGRADENVFHAVRLHPTTCRSGISTATRRCSTDGKPGLSRRRFAGQSRHAGGGSQRP